MKRAITLSLELGSSPGTLALFEGSQFLCESIVSEGMDHCESFLPKLEEALADQGVLVSSINRLVTSAGPGSFTGLRIAFATLKAFCHVNQIGLETVWAPEIRLLKWVDKNSLPTHCEVVTYLSPRKILISKFEGTKELESCPVEIAQLEQTKVWRLWDTRSAQLVGVQTERGLVDISARDLVDYANQAHSLKTYEEFIDWAGLSPEYVAAKF